MSKGKLNAKLHRSEVMLVSRAAIATLELTKDQPYKLDFRQAQGAPEQFMSGAESPPRRFTESVP